MLRRKTGLLGAHHRRTGRQRQGISKAIQPDEACELWIRHNALERSVIDALIPKARQVCHCSKATRGNVDVP
jgi:hypothetical protein